VTDALRVALIWHDEVMSDVVLEKPRPITLGPEGKTTFVVPNIGLPAHFAIVRPGNRGYLLTLGERMGGTICIDGEEKQVSDFVHRNNEGDGPGGFRATPISGKDWGVIDLDESGDYKLFFQFVPLEEAPVYFTKPVLYAGLGGFAISSIALTTLFYLRARDIDVAEAIFRGAGLSALALIVGGLVFWAYKQEGESQASLAFSIVMHAALLIMTYQLYNGENPFVWPGPRSLTGNYLVTRLDPEPPPEPAKTAPTVGKVNKEEAAAASATPKNIKTATKNDEGASGGKGEQERARTTDPKEGKEPPKVAFFEDKNKKYLDNIIDRNLSTSLSKFTGIQGDTVRSGSIGFGPGTGTGVGDGANGTGTTRGSKGKGSGGGGNVDGDFVSNKGPIDTGKERPGGTCVGAGCQGAAPRAVAVKMEDATGDFNGLSKEEIDRVVKARAGVFRACYQKELNRSPGIGGKLIIHFVIGADGTVKSSATQGGTLRNEGVESCVKGNIMRLKFPAKGGAIVNYPFVFTQGG
jgi:hypothetical protein